MGDEGASLAPPHFANDEPAVTLLHISDVQFGKHHRFADEGGGFGTLLQRLCEDLDLLKRDNGLVPNLVALTGDLAEWGMKREFEQVAEFGEGLLRYLQLEPARLLIVPGNHDINRSPCEAYFESHHTRITMALSARHSSSGSKAGSRSTRVRAGCGSASSITTRCGGPPATTRT